MLFFSQYFIFFVNRLFLHENDPISIYSPCCGLFPLCIIDVNSTVLCFVGVFLSDVFYTYIDAAKDKTDRNTRGTLLLIVHCHKILEGEKCYCVEKTKGKAKLSTR